MPLSMQVKLLRVLEAKTIQRLGSVKEIPLDIRIVAATNRDLQKAVADGSFREDLYYRLNVITIHVPPLCERPGDILLLADAFIKKFAQKIGRDIKGIDTDAARLLTTYSWPGNVRELQNVLERAVVLCRSDHISKTDLSGLSNHAVVSPESSGEILPLSEVEKRHIKLCLEQHNWNMTLCAEKLGIHRNTLRAKIKEFQLEEQ